LPLLSAAAAVAAAAVVPVRLHLKTYSAIMQFKKTSSGFSNKQLR
jgi:hypothetical protein